MRNTAILLALAVVACDSSASSGVDAGEQVDGQVVDNSPTALTGDCTEYQWQLELLSGTTETTRWYFEFDLAGDQEVVRVESCLVEGDPYSISCESPDCSGDLPPALDCVVSQAYELADDQARVSCGQWTRGFDGDGELTSESGYRYDVTVWVR